MLNQSWKREIARDIIALGSMPFYLIVVVRALIGEDLTFVYHLVIALGILFILTRLVKTAHQHVGRGFILLFFISSFYNELLFTLSTSILFLLMIASAWYLKVTKSALIQGLVVGVVSTAVSYAIITLLI